MDKQRGFTLMELLVVLLIIGILSSVALRTVDATRDRGLYEQTVAEMKQLVEAITGNPDLAIDGRRTDFGFYGDMGRLPQDLRELTANTSGSLNWNGPYLRRTFLNDSTGYLSDAWGRPYTYDRLNGTIASLGNGRYPLTVRVIDSLPQLAGASITGNVADAEGNPPGELAPTIAIFLWLHGTPELTVPDRSGYYRYENVPIGTHRIVVRRPGADSIVRWVSVAPRSRVVMDFRFSRPFRNYLRLVGSPELAADSAGFLITVVNDGSTPDTVRWIRLVQAPDSAYMRMLYIYGQSGERIDSVNTGQNGVGKGGTWSVLPDYLVGQERTDLVKFGFWNFHYDIQGNLPKRYVAGDTFRLLFNDGSEIIVTP